VNGTVVEVRVFNRHGVDKDQRALQIEKEEIERLAKDRDDELAILERNIFGRLQEILTGKVATTGPKGFKKGEITADAFEQFSHGQWW
jgi:DNA-directed RNA polymerase subunit beta